MDMLFQHLGHEKVDGIVLCIPIAQCRVPLGTQVLQALIDSCVREHTRWQSVILCGTQCDRCTHVEIQNFRQQMLAKMKQWAPSVLSGNVAITSAKHQNGFDELKQCINRLPNQPLTFTQPTHEVLRENVVRTTGVQPPPLIVEREVHVHHHHGGDGCAIL